MDFYGRIVIFNNNILAVKIYHYRSSMHADYYARKLRRNVVNQACVFGKTQRFKKNKIKK